MPPILGVAPSKSREVFVTCLLLFRGVVCLLFVDGTRCAVFESFSGVTSSDVSASLDILYNRNVQCSNWLSYQNSQFFSFKCKYLEDQNVIKYVCPVKNVELAGFRTILSSTIGVRRVCLRLVSDLLSILEEKQFALILRTFFVFRFASKVLYFSFSSSPKRNCMLHSCMFSFSWIINNVRTIISTNSNSRHWT